VHAIHELPSTSVILQMQNGRGRHDQTSGAAGGTDQIKTPEQERPARPGAARGPTGSGTPPVAVPGMERCSAGSRLWTRTGRRDLVGSGSGSVEHGSLVGAGHLGKR
jgi:hypothetical protein